MRCAFCKFKIISFEKYQKCPSCERFYHIECWKVNEGCIIKHSYDTVSAKDTTLYPAKEALETTPALPKRRINYPRVILTFGILILVIVIGILLGIHWSHPLPINIKATRLIEKNKYEDAIKLYHKQLKQNISAEQKETYLKEIFEIYKKITAQLISKNDLKEALNKANELTKLSPKEGKELKKFIYIFSIEKAIDDKDYLKGIKLACSALDELGWEKELLKYTYSIYFLYLTDPGCKVSPSDSKELLKSSTSRKIMQNLGFKTFPSGYILKGELNNYPPYETIIIGYDKSRVTLDIYQLTSITTPKLLYHQSYPSSLSIRKIGFKELNNDKKEELILFCQQKEESGIIIVFMNGENFDSWNSFAFNLNSPQIANLDQDNKAELIFNSTFPQGWEGSKAIAINFPVIYHWQNGYLEDVSELYPEYYQKNFLPQLSHEIEAPPQMSETDLAVYKEIREMAKKKVYKILKMSLPTPADKKSPEETLKNYFEYLKNKQYLNAYLCRENTSLDFNRFLNEWKTNSKIELNTASIFSETSNEAIFEVNFTSKDILEGKEREAYYKAKYILVKDNIDNGWYIKDSEIISYKEI